MNASEGEARFEPPDVCAPNMSPGIMPPMTPMTPIPMPMPPAESDGIDGACAGAESKPPKSPQNVGIGADACPSARGRMDGAPGATAGGDAAGRKRSLASASFAPSASWTMSMRTRLPEAGSLMIADRVSPRFFLCKACLKTSQVTGASRCCGRALRVARTGSCAVHRCCEPSLKPSPGQWRSQGSLVDGHTSHARRFPSARMPTSPFPTIRDQPPPPCGAALPPQDTESRNAEQLAPLPWIAHLEGRTLVEGLAEAFRHPSPDCPDPIAELLPIRDAGWENLMGIFMDIAYPEDRFSPDVRERMRDAFRRRFFNGRSDAHAQFRREIAELQATSPDEAMRMCAVASAWADSHLWCC